MRENETLLQYLLFAMIDYEHLRTKKKKKKKTKHLLYPRVQIPVKILQAL